MASFFVGDDFRYPKHFRDETPFWSRSSFKSTRGPSDSNGSIFGPGDGGGSSTRKDVLKMSLLTPKTNMEPTHGGGFGRCFSFFQGGDF